MATIAELETRKAAKAEGRKAPRAERIAENIVNGNLTDAQTMLTKADARTALEALEVLAEMLGDMGDAHWRMLRILRNAK